MATPASGKNRKKILIVGWMPPAGLEVLKKRDDVDYEVLVDDSVASLHPKLKDANAVTLGATPFRQAELDAAPGALMAGNLLDAEYTEAKVGRRVEVTWQKLNDDFELPQFRLAKD